MTFPVLEVPIPSVLLPRRPFAGQSTFVPIATEAETQAFLEDIGDLQNTIDLWDAHSGIPGMLSATLTGPRANTGIEVNVRTKAEVYFDALSGRYRYVISERLVPVSRQALGALRVARYQEGIIKDITQRMVRGEISEAVWYNLMRKELKDQYRSAYLASIGGRINYTRSEVSRFGWVVRPQYRWLDNFLNELNSGAQPKNGFAVRRAMMYARAGAGIYQNSLFKVAERNAIRFARRVLGVTDFHCHDTATRPGCVELAMDGYVPMRQVVMISDAACLSNCLCRFEFK